MKHKNFAPFLVKTGSKFRCPIFYPALLSPTPKKAKLHFFKIPFAFRSIYFSFLGRYMCHVAAYLITLYCLQ